MNQLEYRKLKLSISMLQSGNFNFVNSIKPPYLHYHVVPNGDVVWGVVCENRVRSNNRNNRSSLTCRNKSSRTSEKVINEEDLKYLSNDQVLDTDWFDLMQKLRNDGVIT